MSTWDAETDVLVVGSGCGLCAALTARNLGAETLVIDKQPTVGGTTALSGGVLWIPNNSLMHEAGLPDSYEDASRYLNNVAGEPTPGSTPERRAVFLHTGPEVVDFLRRQGLKLRLCDDYTDYYDQVPGAHTRTRAVEPEPFDAKSVGEWFEKLPRRSGADRLVVQAVDVPHVSRMGRTIQSIGATARVVRRTVLGYARGQRPVAGGASLVAQMLKLCVTHGVDIWTETALQNLVLEHGRVTGLVAERDGRQVHIAVRRGVVLCAGGFAHNLEMRERYQRHPISDSWSATAAGDTGEALQEAMRIGVATERLDESWWMPSVLRPDGSPLILIAERSKPYCIMVDGSARRFVNEAAPYMNVGHAMYRDPHHPAVPAWFIMDARHRKFYTWGATVPGIVPPSWLRSGYFARAETIEQLAVACGLEASILRETVDRYNRAAVIGKDEEFHKGESVYDRYYGDPRCYPNPCMGTIEEPPFYAVRVFPGDVGTAGGIVTDEQARVLLEDGSVVEGLYGAGNSTASVVARSYPGPGATIGPAFVWAYIAATHAAGGIQSPAHAQTVGVRT